jgi:hypothetical protein
MLKGEWIDELVYAILDHEWQARTHQNAAQPTRLPDT